MCKKIKKAENLAILSSCCGVTGEAVLTDSAVILLFAASLGGKEYLGLLSMAVLPLLNGLLILPLAKLSNRFGNRKLITGANILALCGYFLAASAPWWGNTPGKMILLGGILFFSICQTGFLAGWFPFLESFLLPERRTLFLGRMRFYHQLAAVSFLGLGAIFSLLFITPETLWGKFAATLLLMTISFVIAAGSVICGATVMAFAPPGNKTLAMAFWGCFYYGGGGFSRLFAAFTISCGKLPLYLSLFFVLTAFLPLLAGRTFIQQEQQCNNR